MNTNKSTEMGLSRPNRRCIRKRKAYPVCAYKTMTIKSNDLGDPAVVFGLCKGCKRHEQMKAATAQQRQRRLASTRNLKTVNDNLIMELDAHDYIQGETETERFRLKSMVAGKLAEIEELRRRKEAMVMAYNYGYQL